MTDKSKTENIIPPITDNQKNDNINLPNIDNTETNSNIPLGTDLINQPNKDTTSNNSKASSSKSWTLIAIIIAVVIAIILAVIIFTLYKCGCICKKNSESENNTLAQFSSSNINNANDSIPSILPNKDHPTAKVYQ